MKWYLEEIIIAVFAVSFGLAMTRFRRFFLLYVHREGISATVLVTR